MRFLTFTALAIVLCSSAHAREKWEYPAAGARGSGYLNNGRSGKFRTFALTTNDPVEKVILWYAKQVGLRDDHSLVKTASVGFSKIDTPSSGSWTIANDTDNKQDGCVISSHIASTHAHVHMVFRPDKNRDRDVSISITQTPKGTSILLIESLPEASQRASQ
jgi:hypothetical protein